jgi:hypothetical protein
MLAWWRMLHNTAEIYEFIEAEIGTRVVSHDRYDTFQMAELVVPRHGQLGCQRGWL